MANMRRHRYFQVTRRQPNWLLVCAMLALSVHALANMGLMPARGSDTGDATSPFFADICTGKAAPQFGASPLRTAFAGATEHEADWCELCSIAGSPALASTEPTPTLAVESGVHVPAMLPIAPLHAEWILQAPRGPPHLG